MDMPNSSIPVAAASRVMQRDARGQPYEPAVGPRLKVILFFIFACVALLGATGVYLLAISLLERLRKLTITNQFTIGMLIAHIFVGVVLVVPFLAFGIIHLATARKRKNKLAVKLGISLFIMGILAALTGVALIQLSGLPQIPTGTYVRAAVYAWHLVTPVAAVVLYILHRRAGPDIHWNWGISWGVAVALFVGVMAAMHSQDPRRWYAKGSPDGEKYFHPSLARTVSGNFIPEKALIMDEYCLKCHPDIYNNHIHSAHKGSSFSNPAYFFSVLETRKVANQRDGNPRASRWCAGCHDPVPFFSGAFDEPVFDDPTYDVSKHVMAGAGITCTICHGIINVNSPVGNGDYTIEEPLHYPFAYSDNPVLQWVNNQAVKAKPEFHKKTFLKDFHRSEQFCSVCHKVGIPKEVNHYKEFLRGQDHNTTFLLSGVSGHGARSFYYPPEAKTRCAECHMPLKPSQDFGSRDFDGTGQRKIHDHLFLGANTGLAALLGYAGASGKEEIIKAHSDFLRGTDPEGKDKKLRIDLFAVKPGGTIDGQPLVLRPELPKLEPGKTYLVEVVIRTVNMGHPFTQGTADSNEVWVHFQAKAGNRILGESGALDGPDETGQVDPWSHFINILMLDRHGNRIDRRNPQDIFTPLYNHQIPPGAAQVVHYKLEVPSDIKDPVQLKVRLRYRKFDYKYMEYVYKGAVPKLPIVDMCEDEVTLPVAGLDKEVPAQTSPIKPAWQRWNDYGIGCFLEGGVGSKKGELVQAKAAFEKLLTLEAKDAQGHAYLNLARVAFDLGRLDDAVEYLGKARDADPPAPWWTVSWFSGLVNAQNGHLDQAIANFEQILDPNNQPRQRKFDFTLDYVVINEHAKTLFLRSQQERDSKDQCNHFLGRAVRQYQATLKIDPEDIDAHYGLRQCYEQLGESFVPAAPANSEIPLDEASLRQQANILANSKEPRDRRMYAAAALGQGAAPKLALLQSLIARVQPIFDLKKDPELAVAAAFALGNLHRHAHAIFKPDEIAQGQAVTIYRQAHPAANHAAEAIVIYPTLTKDKEEKGK